MITADQVIRERQREIFDRTQEIGHELTRLKKQIELLKAEEERLIMEHDILESYDHRSDISITTTTTTVRMKGKDKLTFEDTLRKVFDNAGRPMRMIEIITELGKFGYQWSKYESAHSYIKNIDGVIKVPQTRGIYQWMR